MKAVLSAGSFTFAMAWARFLILAGNFTELLGTSYLITALTGMDSPELEIFPGA